jgi:4-oxalocrotonate tautomerase
MENNFMPYIQVSLYPGRSDQQKQDFAKAITKSAVDILKTKEEHVIVVFDEKPKENWFLAGNQL